MIEEWGKARQFAAQLAEWDNRIVEVVGIEHPTGEGSVGEKRPDLICSFDPEPSCDSIGYFWIVNLLTRMEFEGLDEKLDLPRPFDLGFKIGKQAFLPNGQILREAKDQVVLWPNHEQ